MVFLSLILHSPDVSADTLWNIYHNMYLNDAEVDVLESHLRALLRGDSSMLAIWTGDPHEGVIRSCDEETRTNLVRVFEQYRRTASRLQRRPKFPWSDDGEHPALTKGRQHYVECTSIPAPSPRSSAPVYDAQLEHVAAITKYAWEKGTVNKHDPQTDIFNPLFRVALIDQTRCYSMALGYPHNPILRFHLAPASLNI